MKEAFERRTLSGIINLKLKDASTGLIRQWSADKLTIVNEIISTVNKYQAQGFRLTLRQLYYQLVKANTIPNHDTCYKKLGTILDDCRYSGNVDWSAIEDRGRIPKLPYWVTGISDALKDTVQSYRLNRQEGQKKLIELWTEKDAISNILFRITSQYHINLVVNKGYTSSSAIYQAYDRFVEQLNAQRPIVVLYFGDHDPSGLDMVRDIEDRLIKMFAKGKQFNQALVSDWLQEDQNNYEIVRELSFEIFPNCDPDDDESGDQWYYVQTVAYLKEFFKIIPIGLTMNQIKQYSLPPNPAKINDPRAGNYIKKFGRTSWEVDALSPDILMQIVQDNIEKNIDRKQFDKMLKEEKKQKKTIETFAANYK